MARILIVDDDTAIIEQVTDILQAAGHRVESRLHTAGLGQAVRDIAPDLIILDIHFPDDPQAGIKAARRLTQDPRLCRIPILMLSAINRNTDLPFSLSDNDISEDFLPIDAFIDKPVQAGPLLQKVEKLLSPGGESPIQRCRVKE